jgi:hypothetical protein
MLGMMFSAVVVTSDRVVLGADNSAGRVADF